MKYLRNFFAMVIIVIVAVCSRPQNTFAQVSVNFQVFYDDLSPYGSWINYPSYGYVWSPGMGSGFRPYATGGHWVMTEFGWTWVSDYSWGWAPFHYGRWELDPGYGWIWIPGTVWGPAWVSWRSSPGYYGWVPLGYKRDNDRDDRWVFVSDRDIDRGDVEHYYVSPSSNYGIRKNSSSMGNSGPTRDEVQKKTGKQINMVTVQNNDKPGQSLSNGQLKIYKPKVQPNNVNGDKPAPKVVKPSPTGNGNVQPKVQPKQQPEQQPKVPPKVQPKQQPPNQSAPQNSGPPNNGGQNQQVTPPDNNNGQLQDPSPQGNNNKQKPVPKKPKPHKPPQQKIDESL